MSNQPTDEEIAETGNFWRFIHDYILPQNPAFKDYSWFHKRIILASCRALSVTAAPRGSSKSQILAKYRTLFLLLTRPKNSTDILIVSETSRLSQDHLFWVRTNIESNELIRRDFGDQVPSEQSRYPWNMDEIKLANGNRVVAIGYQGQVRGRHPTDIIVDDLESSSNIGTEESLAKLRDWFYRVLMGSMLPTTRLSVIGTVIQKPCLLLELLSRPEFNGRLYKALSKDKEGNDVSIWPTLWPVSWLHQRRHIMGMHEFMAEYQNEPIGLRDQIIKPEWIRRHNQGVFANMKTVARYIACDPAFTEEKWGCYSAVVVLDQTENGQLFERMAWRGKMGLPELTSKLIEFYRHFSQDIGQENVYFAIEEVAAQKAIRQSIVDKDPTINVLAVKPDRDKVRRLLAVSKYIENGTVSFMTEGMVDELLSFPVGDKDRIDALVYTLVLYAQNNPSALMGQKYSEIDITKQLGDNALSLYMDRANAGIPQYEVPQKLRDNYNRAMRVQSMFDGDGSIW